VEEVIRRRKELPEPPSPHKGAIVIAPGDAQGWDLTKFYESMVRLHYPMDVIIFGEEATARIWLGIEKSGI
jgi:hypothetical protein